jgi:hypothetical protein
MVISKAGRFDKIITWSDIVVVSECSIVALNRELTDLCGEGVTACHNLSLSMSSTTAMSAIYAINTIDANDGTVNIAGRDQITINHFHVDHNCDTGKLIKQSF